MKVSRLWETASICLLTLCLAVNAHAGAINVPMTGTISGFGPALYYGQTFIALPGEAEDLTVYVGVGRPVRYHLLITEIDTTNVLLGYIHPTNVLFESGTLVSSGTRVTPNPITVDLGGLSLTAGEKYAWILDAYVEIEANPQPIPGGPYPSALVGLSSDNFPDIESVDFHLGPFPSGTREEHFNSFWYTNWQDLAFTMNFSDLPVTIDIKPRKNPKNNIDLRKDKELKVAIVGSDTFDALQVDPSTVKFGPSEASPINFKGQDYNRDGYSDLILIFNLSATGIVCGVTEATLSGETVPDPVTSITGSDSFSVEPCN